MSKSQTKRKVIDDEVEETEDTRDVEKPKSNDLRTAESYEDIDPSQASDGTISGSLPPPTLASRPKVSTLPGTTKKFKPPLQVEVSGSHVVGNEFYSKSSKDAAIPRSPSVASTSVVNVDNLPATTNRSAASPGKQMPKQTRKEKDDEVTEQSNARQSEVESVDAIDVEHEEQPKQKPKSKIAWGTFWGLSEKDDKTKQLLLRETKSDPLSNQDELLAVDDDVQIPVQEQLNAIHNQLHLLGDRQVIGIYSKLKSLELENIGLGKTVEESQDFIVAHERMIKICYAVVMYLKNKGFVPLAAGEQPRNDLSLLFAASKVAFRSQTDARASRLGYDQVPETWPRQSPQEAQYNAFNWAVNNPLNSVHSSDPQENARNTGRATAWQAMKKKMQDLENRLPANNNNN
jgi:hypothetical protein